MSESANAAGYYSRSLIAIAKLKGTETFLKQKYREDYKNVPIEGKHLHSNGDILPEYSFERPDPPIYTESQTDRRQ